MTDKMSIVYPGTGAGDSQTPSTPYGIPHRGTASATALRDKFGAAIISSEAIWGTTTVYVDPARVLEIARWLHDDPSQQYDYLVDVTAVEYRDIEVPIEVVWHLRSLPFRRFIRIKARLDKKKPLEIPSVWDVWKCADWLERECYDMFGIRFLGHPDLRRILMWEQYKEGYPLRKDFPIRGRFSRAEQLRQALAQNPEAKYSMEELSVAAAFEDIPDDMRERLRRGERTGE